jgi:hypothetical protein
MGDLLVTTDFILFFILLILFALKIEYHFSYFKILYPDRLNKYSSFVDSQTRFSPKITDIKIEAFLPYFTGRRKDLEKDNYKLNRLATKIITTCRLINLDLMIFIPILIINLLRHFK